MGTHREGVLVTLWPRRLRSGPLEPWQRDQYVIVLCVAIASAAFELTQPFFPLFIRELGVSDLSEAAFWAGMTQAAGPLMTGLIGPVWGHMADRYGRKLMVLRALVVISVMHAALAFVPNVYYLVAVRAGMGAFAGFTPMAMALAISIGPRDRMAHAVGLIQAAQFLPQALGPTLGGVISDTFGVRTNFVLTAVLLFIPSVMLFFLVKESGLNPHQIERAPAERRASEQRSSVGAVLLLLTLPGFVAGLLVHFMVRFTDRALNPILPLYLVEIDTPAAQLATITGFVVASGAVAAAGSSVLYGRWSRPDNTLKLLMIALVGGAISSALLVLTSTWPQVVLLRVLLGILAGGTVSLAFTLGARLVPSEKSGVSLAVLASSGQFGAALAPMMAGVVGEISLRLVFLATAVAYVLTCGLVVLLMARGDRTARVAASPAPAPEANQPR